MPRFGKITVIGLGLIGGSVGMAAVKRGVAGEVWGVARREETVEKALEMGAVNRGTLSLAEGVAGSDIVIVCTPVGSIPGLVMECLSCLKPGAVVTDAGSTKAGIVKKVAGIMPPDTVFIGSHPVAGSEKAGIDSASGDLLEGASCIITPFPGRTEGADRTKEFWESLGMRTMIMDPEEHDRILALTSHLPHLVASGLVKLLSGHAGETGKLRSAAAGGFRDTTRIASSPPELWLDILLENRDNIADSLEEYIGILAGMESVLRNGDREGILDFLEKARAFRGKITGEEA